MRTSLILLAACALVCCRNDQPSRAVATEDERMLKEYETWAAQQPRPPTQLVDHVEALLAREPCVGSLDRWSRHYGYNRLPERTVDKAIVDFHLEEVGTPDVKPGRHITEPSSWVNIDDRPIRMIEGDYDVKEDRIRIAFCTNNVGGPDTGDINNMNAYFDELKRRRLAHGT
jgi:hypothetical protein